MAAELASGPTTAFGRIKRLLDASDRATLADQLDAEAASIAACADHPEGRAGVAAFRGQVELGVHPAGGVIGL